MIIPRENTKIMIWVTVQKLINRRDLFFLVPLCLKVIFIIRSWWENEGCTHLFIHACIHLIYVYCIAIRFPGTTLGLEDINKIGCSQCLWGVLSFSPMNLWRLSWWLCWWSFQFIHLFVGYLGKGRVGSSKHPYFKIQVINRCFKQD